MYDKKQITKLNYEFFILIKYYAIVDKYKVIPFVKDISYKAQKFSATSVQINSFYLIQFINFLKIKKRTLFFRTFYKIYKNNLLLLTPSFTFLSQFFEYRSIFFNILKIYNIDGFFIYKNLYKNIGYYNDYSDNYIIYGGYNFYVIKNSYIIFQKLNEILQHKDYNNIGKVKFFFEKQPSNSNLNFNYYFIYNIYTNNVVELYKLIILIYLSILKIN